MTGLQQQKNNVPFVIYLLFLLIIHFCVAESCLSFISSFVRKTLSCCKLQSCCVVFEKKSS